MEIAINNKTDFERKVNAIISYILGIDEKKITPQSNFRNNFYVDFLSMVDLVIEFEKEFNISIPDEQIEKINTVSEAHECIKRNRNQLLVA